MSDLKKDLFALKYSPSVDVVDIEEEVVDLVLDDAPDVGTTIEGTVTDGENPVPGATVKVFDNNGNPYMHTITGADGKYLFENLPVGNYSVAVAHKNYRLSDALSAALVAGSTMTLNFSMQKDVTLDLGAITGVVSTMSNDDKIALANVKVSLMDDTNAVVAVTHTANDGEFAFYDIADGTYTILARKQGYNVSTLLTAIVVNGSIVNTEIVLTVDEISNTGTVNGVIKNQQGNIVAGCFVGLYKIVINEDGTRTETLVAKTKTNSLGKYLFGDVVSGKYIVKAKMNA